MNKFILTLLCLVFSQNAIAFCTTIRPRTYVTTKPGTVRYITHLSRDEFLKNAPQKMSPNTLGMTVSKLGLSGSAEPRVENQGPRACVQMKSITFTLGYDILDVYIDKKYTPGTCEYEVVKEHENYHVRVAQEAMEFFRSDIEKALDRAVGKLTPVYVSSQAEAERAFQNQFQQVFQDMQPLLNHINAKIAEKNYIIDTPESYRDTTALCDNW